ncbi:MAG TPA: rod shape-determining protein MreC [Burkholderiales bacterium]|nr:rod shape-determining protein MreC [Burkholderiales bacterium]
MEHNPPPFFNTGPSPLARLLIFSMLSLVLLATDARFKYLTTVRQVASVLIYPIQRIALAPGNLARRAAEFFVSNAALREDNARLTEESLRNAALLLQFQALQAENANLRSLLEARERSNAEARLGEVLYAARDPFSRKIIIDKGAQEQVKDGQPVIDQKGVVGQVTRVYPWVSEVTLITDKNHLVPVLNPRNGLRAVLAGTGNDGELELRFVPLNSDFQTGDRLVTSGIDGVYPPGLPVAEIANVERNAAYLFARISCRPVAGVNSNNHVLIVQGMRPPPERPKEEPAPAPRSRKSRKAAP